MALLGSSPDFPGVFAPNHEEITESAEIRTYGEKLGFLALPVLNLG
jgi:hypothetical protein